MLGDQYYLSQYISNKKTFKWNLKNAKSKWAKLSLVTIDENIKKAAKRSRICIVILKVARAGIPDSNDVTETQMDAIHLGNEDGGNRLVECCAVHVNCGSDCHNKPCYSGIYLVVLLQALERDWQCCCAATEIILLHHWDNWYKASSLRIYYICFSSEIMKISELTECPDIKWIDYFTKIKSSIV